ncbi:MAG TPA: protein kinase [Bryobacteraceae bacterium]|jgi:serine/threonine-protein kinase|nr:protein kinase [Bryobacteraceae bacterium]
MNFQVGDKISDYEVLGMLGAGGMGCVYRVRNLISQRVEAMKVLLPDLTSEPELAERFISEIRVLAGFLHPNIAQLHTAFQANNQLVMVMEFVEGLTLAERSKKATLPLRDVMSYMSQTLAALACAHEHGVIHRDIKPGNIMVTPHGVVKLMDFGIAKSKTETMKTQPGTTLGSLHYMSPEQIHGVTVDARSDLYSVGVTLYELTAGRRPFEGDSEYAILDQQLNAQPKPPIQLNPAMPPGLNDLILTALAKDPMHRFQSADAFRKALDTVQAGMDPPKLSETQPAGPGARYAQPGYVHPVGPPPLPVSSQGHRGLWMAMGALVVVLVLVGAGIAVPHFLHSHAATITPPPAMPTSSIEPAKPVNREPMHTTPISRPAPVSQPVATAANRPVTDTVPAPRKDMQAAPPSPRRAPVENPQPTPPATPVQSPVQTPSGPSQAELDQANERMVQLSARAAAVQGTVNLLRQQMAVSGLGLRQDMAAALSRLETRMDAASRALRANDPASAQKLMDAAEKDVDTLEAFTGR